MPSAVTTKLIDALKRTTDRIDDFLESNRIVSGELAPSPFGYMTFCSFLVTASYAPGKERFPNTSIERAESDTKEFKKIIVQAITHSVLQRHAGAIALMRGEAEKDEHAAGTERQVQIFVDEKYAEYFKYFQSDVEELADGKGMYKNLSAAFMRDVLARTESDLPESEPSVDSVSFGLCLSTTVAGLLSYFEND